MNAHIDYSYTMTANGTLDIESVGNCAIKAEDNFDNYYFIVVRTEYGITRFYTSGVYSKTGYQIDYKATFEQFDYSENKIYKKIEKFLNNGFISSAKVVDESEITKYLINPYSCMYQERTE